MGDIEELIKILEGVGFTDVTFKESGDGGMGDDDTLSFSTRTMRIDISGHGHNDYTGGLQVRISQIKEGEDE